jgi:uncharacterized membrane protein AbrB (regulator of aidB expression)
LESLATKAQTILEGLSAPVSCLAIAPSGLTVVAGSAVASHDVNAPTIVLWDYHTEGKYWFEKATYSFDRGAQLPVSCLAFDRSGRYFAAVGVNGSNGLRGQLPRILRCFSFVLLMLMSGCRLLQ